VSQGTSTTGPVRTAERADPAARAHRQLLDDQRNERRRTFRRPQRTVDTTRANRAGLGGRHLGFGISLSGGFVALFLLWRFSQQWDLYTNPAPTVAAWALLLVAAIVTLVVTNGVSDRLPTWFFLTVLATGEVIVALDLVPYSPAWSPCGGAVTSWPPRWCSAPSWRRERSLSSAPIRSPRPTRSSRSGCA
jgi:hypothetical protein